DFIRFAMCECSTDGSAARAAEIKDDRLKFIRHSKNLGTSATINEGISLSQGEYISIINSDDVYHEDRLERLYSYCIDDKTNLIGTAVVLVDENSVEIQSDTHWWKEWYGDLLRFYRESRNVYRSLLRGNFYISSSNFFFRRTLIHQIGD